MAHISYRNVLVIIHIISAEIVGNLNGCFSFLLGKVPTISTDIILSLENLMRLEKHQHSNAVNYSIMFYSK